MNGFDGQFNWDREYYLKGLDFPTWYRYLYLIKEIIYGEPENLLEVGVGSKVIENIFKDKVKNYITMDINSNLNCDIVGDLREFNSSLLGMFDCVVCADVLEHMPFKDLKLNLKNIFNYLIMGGVTLITIPHRRKEMLIISRFPGYKTFFISLPIWITPRGFYQWFIKKKVWIDPYHCWEIGDGKIRKADVEDVYRTVGFKVNKFIKLPYVDFWVLKKS